MNFFEDVKQIATVYEGVIATINAQKDQSLNPAKIKAKILDQFALKQDSLEAELNDYFDV